MAQSISGELVWDKAYQVLFNRESVLGHWLSKKNAIERIGPYLFVHAGISPKLATMNLSIGHINETVRTSIYKDLLTKPGSDSIANFLMGREGPLWYRGMVTDYKQYLKMTTRQFDEVLTYTGAGKIVIGHTVVADINTDHGGRLIKTDILHGSLINRGRTKGVFVENKREFVTDDQGKRSALGAW
ncbi:MAG: hypothetical protein EOP51_34430 [Sphingobacteriales bacterium]|nr:MAG: hypothetical protein EOP51_34430 [Sphingobacteriales bacterium]